MTTPLERVLNGITSMVLGDHVYVIHAEVVAREDGQSYLDTVWLVAGGMIPRDLQLREGNVGSDVIMLPLSARKQVRDMLSKQKVDGPFRHELLSAGLLHPVINDIPS